MSYAVVARCSPGSCHGWGSEQHGKDGRQGGSRAPAPSTGGKHHPSSCATHPLVQEKLQGDGLCLPAMGTVPALCVHCSRNAGDRELSAWDAPAGSIQRDVQSGTLSLMVFSVREVCYPCYFPLPSCSLSCLGRDAGGCIPGQGF